MSKGTPRHGASRSQNTRKTGGEFRVLLWLLRNPSFLAVPAVLLTGWYLAGLMAVGYGVGGVVVGMVAWSRAHPVSFDRWAAPRLRATWRRRWTYRGSRWKDVLDDCELTRENRATGQIQVPRLIRVTAPTPTIDVLQIRPVRGQDLRTWTDRAEALTDALDVHRVGLTKKRPGRLTLVIERDNPFRYPVPPPDIPDAPEDVDPAALEVGEDEYGHPVTVSINGGKHLLVAGATESGKGSLLWCPLRSMGPMIKEGWVRPWCIDMKHGVETEIGKDLFGDRRAITGSDAVALLKAFRDNMVAKQNLLVEKKIRRAVIGPDWPADVMFIDEMAMLTAYTSDGAAVRDALRTLAEILTQGRATKDTVFGYVQEPSKDVVQVRELFPSRICLAVTSASHVDMTLGDSARDRGALADEIPLDPAHAGTGFRVDKGSRTIRRIRAGWTLDEDIAELVQRCTPQKQPRLTVVKKTGREVA